MAALALPEVEHLPAAPTNTSHALLEDFFCQRRRLTGACRHRIGYCPKCGGGFQTCALIDKESGKLCPQCAHAYELKIFTPADHHAASCSLCTDSFHTTKENR